MVSAADVQRVVGELKAAYDRNDNAGCHQTSMQFKLLLVQLPGTIPGTASPALAKELGIAREGLEYVMMYAVRLEDEDAFQRAIGMLRPCYASCAAAGLPRSANEGLATALYMLFLLVQKRTAEFHMELELLSPELLADQHLQSALSIEQAIMEGAYTKVIAMNLAATQPHFKWFMGLLAVTMRDDIASCIESSYVQLSARDAAQLMMVSDANEVMRIAGERGWTQENGVFRFKQGGGKVKEPIPAQQLMSNTIAYTSELERVV